MKIIIFSIGLFITSAPFLGFAQTDDYLRFNWEVEFARHVKDKWALETTVSSERTSKPNETNLFEFYSRFGLEFWGLYFLDSKWQLGCQVAYFDNQRVPELNQEQSNEFRFSGQGIYFIKKIGFNLASRSRVEARFEQDDDREYNPVFHFRQRIQLIYPFNSKVIRKGVVYGILTEEISFKTNNDVKGEEFFDRNTFRAGAGYAISDNFRVELIYNNSYAPRSTVDQYIQTFQARALVNNFLPRLINYVNEKRLSGSEENE